MSSFFTGGGGGASPADIWNYANRTLTQTKFPFWSAIITQQQGSISVGATGTAYVNIQPPAGETWWIEIGIGQDNYNIDSHAYYDYNGSTRRTHTIDGNNPSYEYQKATVISRILTNTLYGSISWHNSDSLNNHYGYYGYSGFKLSQPLYSLIRDKLIDPPQPWKKPTTLQLPSILSGLQDRVYEFFGIDPNKPNDYVLGILLEEDTPLAYDPVTKFPVERLTVVVSADALAKIIADYKAGKVDLVKAGYGKYIDMFKKAGVI